MITLQEMLKIITTLRDKYQAEHTEFLRVCELLAPYDSKKITKLWAKKLGETYPKYGSARITIEGIEYTLENAAFGTGEPVIFKHDQFCTECNRQYSAGSLKGYKELDMLLADSEKLEHLHQYLTQIMQAQNMLREAYKKMEAEKLAQYYNQAYHTLLEACNVGDNIRRYMMFGEA